MTRAIACRVATGPRVTLLAGWTLLGCQHECPSAICPAGFEIRIVDEDGGTLAPGDYEVRVATDEDEITLRCPIPFSLEQRYCVEAPESDDVVGLVTLDAGLHTEIGISNLLPEGAPIEVTNISVTLTTPAGTVHERDFAAAFEERAPFGEDCDVCIGAEAQSWALPLAE